MIGRRAMLLGGASLVAPTLVARGVAAGLPVPRGDSLAFRIMRHGSQIGTHTIAFERDGDVLTVHTAVDVLVTVLSIPLARYRHRGTETWQGTTLVGMVGETNKTGQRGWMSARYTNGALVVCGSQTKSYAAPKSAMPISYWDKRMLNGPMISLEDGALLSPKVADLKTDSIRIATGRMIPANRYSLSGPLDADIWYDETETWAGMLLSVVDGSEVRYERL